MLEAISSQFSGYVKRLGLKTVFIYCVFLSNKYTYIYVCVCVCVCVGMLVCMLMTACMCAAHEHNVQRCVLLQFRSSHISVEIIFMVKCTYVL